MALKIDSKLEGKICFGKFSQAEKWRFHFRKENGRTKIKTKLQNKNMDQKQCENFILP